MTDVVVTVPKGLWREWIEEGDLPGEAPSGNRSHFWVPTLPEITEFAARVYIVAHGRLRGYAPLVGMERRCQLRPSRSCLIRDGGAVAVTIPDSIRGFQGYRYRWWDREDEIPFPSWKTTGVGA